MSKKYVVDIEVNDSDIIAAQSSVEGLSGSVSGLQSELDGLDGASDGASDSIDKQADSQEDLSKSLDNTTDDTKQLTGATALMGGTMGKVSGILPKVQKGLMLVSTGFKTVRGAIISTGIGALIILLGSLISYFTSTGDGAAKLQKILAPFKILFGNLTDLLSDLGGALVSAFENPKEAIKSLWEFIKSQFIVRIESLVKIVQSAGRIIGAAFELDWDGVKQGAADFGNAYVDAITGIEDSVSKASSAIKGFVDETVDESNKLIEIEDRRNKLRKRENEAIVESAKLNAEIAKQRLISEDDLNYTLEQREAALKKAQEAQAKLFAEEKAIAQERADIMIEEATFSDTSAEGEREIAEAKKSVIELTEQQAKADKKLLSVTETLAREREANSKKEVADEKKKTEAKNKEVADEKNRADKELAIEKKKLDDLRKLRDVASNNELDFEMQMALLNATSKEEELRIEQEFLDKKYKMLVAQLKAEIAAKVASGEYTQVQAEEALNKLAELDKKYLLDSQKLKIKIKTTNADEIKKTADETAVFFDEMIGILGQFGLDGVGEFAKLMTLVKDMSFATTEEAVQNIGAIASAGLHAAAGVANMIANMQDTSTREGFEKQKKARQAGAIMDAFAAAIAGMLAGLEAGGPWGIALGVVTAAASLAFGLMQADKIGKMKYDNPTAPGGGSRPNMTSITPPSNITNPITPTENAAIVATNEMPPVKAYVVANEVETGLAVERTTVSNASF